MTLLVVCYRGAEFQKLTKSTCFTPQNRSGICIHLQECRELTWLLMNRRQDPKAINYLKNSQCGFERNLPKVCCLSPNLTKTISNPENCGTIDIMERIIGGDNAHQGEYPWMVSLAYKKRGNHEYEWFCGGALISSQYVLTAGHCVAGILPWELYMIRVGHLNLNESMKDTASSQDIFIENVIVHENYSQSPVINDIALIKLQHAAKISPFVRPICLPLQPEFRKISFDNQNAIVAGWGRTSLHGPFSSNLKDLDVPILNIDVCKRAYSQKQGSHIDSRNLCAGYLNGEKDSCQGDSGGPLMWLNRKDFKYYVIGIVSYGFRCAERGYPGVYTKISEYINWISRKVQ